MLGSITLRLRATGGHQLEYFNGTLLHGFLIEAAGNDADYLHGGDALRPYSQYCWYDALANSTVWRVNTLNEEAVEIIGGALVDLKSVYLKQKGMEYQVVENSGFDFITYRDLVLSQTNSARIAKNATLTLKTPCALKHLNQHIIFPELKIILAGLYAKWRAFAVHADITEEKLVEEMAAASRITSYSLNSRVFPLGNSDIPAFGGWLKLESRLPLALTALFNALLLFGEYAGIGAKTALGLGAVVTDLRRKEMPR